MAAMPPILFLQGAFSGPEVRMRFVAPRLDERRAGRRVGRG